MRQFGLRELLIGVAMVAGMFGIAHAMTQYHAFSGPVVICLLFPLTTLIGAFVGGLFRNVSLGALIGAVSWFIVLFALIMYPAVQ